MNDLPDKRPSNPVNLLIVAVTVAILSLSAASFYSAYIAHANHQNNCTSRNLIAQSIEDVIQSALAPQPGQTVTAKQFKSRQAFQVAADMRLDHIRC